ncbi:MAG: SDR family NAD(P)-dependent oxidoreductase [Sphingomonadaceae bacterium]|nr:SDR family NAD(P)-dependent oxidoreductase [Sphingomonadaceae bacterium]
MADRSNFGATTTAGEVLEGIDLSGKTAFITGGASGLGTETARAMAARGAHVIIAARDLGKAEAAAKEIREGSGSDKVDVIACDLASLDSVRECAEAANAKYEKIDLLINNAGVMACPQGETADGFEMQFGTNHVGHFLLTNLLMPLVEKGDNPRIVNLSSRGHHFDTVHFDDVNFENRDYEKWMSYGQSKTANIMFSVGLEKRLADKGIHAYAVHPGGIQTNLGRHLAQEDIAMLLKRMEENAGESVAFKTVEAGAATTCFAATAPEIEGQGGVYLEDCHVAEVDDEDPTGSVKSYAVDPDNAEKLWTLSEKMVGQKFGY